MVWQGLARPRRTQAMPMKLSFASMARASARSIFYAMCEKQTSGKHYLDKLTSPGHVKRPARLQNCNSSSLTLRAPWRLLFECPDPAVRAWRASYWFDKSRPGQCSVREDSLERSNDSNYNCATRVAWQQTDDNPFTGPPGCAASFYVSLDLRVKQQRRCTLYASSRGFKFYSLQMSVWLSDSDNVR